ncbi:hypothetical protein HCA69_02535 [Listeria grandensis]|uniref:Uncharacterized protein n=1 Tax=Listeria grandensis TaxID=1494963 RepID=A0A7X0Y1H7_9LIST|nr:hypothetical protein [Listeria grandensis]MBC1935226.1 hypothetical protein [Listeria grandensis]
MEFVKGKDFVFIRTTISGLVGKATFNEEAGQYHFETRGTEFAGKIPERTHKDLDLERVENEFKMGFMKVVGNEQWDFVNVIDELSMKIGIPSMEYLLEKRLEREKVACISELSALQVENATFHFKRKLKALEDTLKK